MAKLISGRIDEILNLTGLTLIGLANLTAVGEKAIRSYHSRTLPISVETVNKLCVPFSISLALFFDFKKPIHLSEEELKTLNEFKAEFFPKKMGYFKEEKDAFIAKPKSKGHKREREYIAYIVKQTEYFSTPRTIAQMIADFERDHNLKLESGRLYELLKKYIGSDLERVVSIKTNQDGLQSKRQIYLYRCKKKS
ncbi:hypothetical protein [Sphingobacterium griseoflavum]|uniref:hypothetical protein n=1 Tax=Sphingobacterium griseoflavum TaxID=1474952 RepID=UPI0016764171|nr:hypothetical protein [Sphingobacterium griseoflavum]